MPELFASGRVVVWILVFMAVEAIALIIVRKKTASGVAPEDLLVSSAAGAALLMALRAALTGAPWTSMGFWLVAALMFHLWDLKRRWSAHRTR